MRPAIHSVGVGAMVATQETESSMPSIKENIDKWNADYDWRLRGDAWSRPWGGAESQWYGSVFPRIRRFLPASAVLEIAPGFGRWTEFLLEHCDTLTAVDVASKCVEGCRERFAHYPQARFETNDGQSLPMVEEESIDFAFSFDSLVHVESDVLIGYLAELARTLKPEGVAFLHHSNYGSYRRSAHAFAPLQTTLDRLPAVGRAGLMRTGVYRGAHWRASSVSASSFAELSEAAGLHCVGQELVNWEGGVVLLDSMSVVTRPGSRWDRPNSVVKNRLFRLEARSIRRSGSVYSLP
jgi:ubiquinone/menaquinone biosynthesis C-methylase UbiE